MTPKVVSLVVWSLVGIAAVQVAEPSKGVSSTELIERLGNTNPKIRDAAIAQLSELGSAVVPALVTALNDPRRLVRGGAVQALGSMGPAAEPAVSALIAKLPNPQLPAVAIPGALSRIGLPAVPALISALEDSHYKIRWGAAESLAGMTVNSPFEKQASAGSTAIHAALHANLDKLEKSLNDPDDRVRAAACNVLGNLRPQATDAVPALVDRLADDEERVAAYAHNALIQLRSVARPDLIQALQHGDPRVARKAAQVLKWERTRKSDIPALIAAFEVPDDDLRLYVSSLFEGLEDDAFPRITRRARKSKRVDSSGSKPGP